MATEQKPAREFKFIRVALPWILAAAMFGVYLFTLQRWVSFGNLDQVASAAGYNWLPQFYGPVTFLLTLPIRLLPAKFIPLGLNIFAALCGAASLGLLARSVVLLPHDRTQEQREKQRTTHWLGIIPTAWLAPVVAVVVCGLGLTFWEYSTCGRSVSMTRFGGGGIEMLDLLLFAYIIRCLLEFRVSQRQSWLFKASFVYGAAIAENWAMFSFAPPFVSFFPLFVATLVWMRGLAFFHVRFLGRMFLWGLAGASLYCLLPLVQAFTAPAAPGFWSALKVAVGTQRQMQASVFTKYQILYSEHPLWVLSLFSLVPILAISIRWPSYFGDTSKLGQAIATFTFHLVHAAFLLLCLWVALDAPISPRIYWPWFPQLTLYYLSALSIGYLIAYFLLVFGAPAANAGRKPGSITVFVNRVVIISLWLICILVPVALLYRNLPRIHVTNGQAFKDFASLMSRNFPQTNAVVLSDDRARLLLLQAYADQTGQSTNLMFLDTTSFPMPDYHRFLRKKYGVRWPTSPGKDVKAAAPQFEQMKILFYLNMSNALYYAHPSFGTYFELFDLEPHGMNYKMVQSATNSLKVSAPPADLIKENEAFWADAEPILDSVIVGTGEEEQGRARTLPEKIFKKLHLSAPGNDYMLAFRRFYSRSRNYWGARMQQAGALPEAEKHFQRALELNSENIVATVNLKCNRLLQKGGHPEVRDPQSALDEFGRYRRWDEVMNDNGPYDEPTFCYAWGLQLADPSNRLIRQAIEQFQRVTVLSPGHLMAQLWLGHLYLLYRHPDEALQVVEDIHAHPELFPPGRTNLAEILHLEASALLEKTNLPAAEKLIDAALSKYPVDDELLSTAVLLYMNYGYHTNALPLLDRQLAAHPDDRGLLMQKGVANLQAGRFEDALPVFDHILNLETNVSETHNTALLNRAITCLRAGKLDEAQRDYEQLQKVFPTAHRIYYGLGQIAYERKDTNAALRNYTLYLTNAESAYANPPANPDEVRSVKARLKELRPGYPSP